MSFKVGDMVWVLDQHNQPMSPAQVEDKTPEGLVVVRFLADNANRLRFPITPKRLSSDERDPILIDNPMLLSIPQSNNKARTA